MSPPAPLLSSPTAPLAGLAIELRGDAHRLDAARLVFGFGVDVVDVEGDGADEAGRLQKPSRHGERMLIH